MTRLTQRKPGRIRTALARIATIIVSLTVAVGALALVVGGRGVLADRAELAERPQAAPRMPVETLTLVGEAGYDVTRRFTGQIEAAQTIDLGFENPGTLAEIYVDEGDVVAENSLLAKLDTRLLDAERAQLLAARTALEAQAELARRTEKRRNALNDRGFASDQSLDSISLSLAELMARIAEVEAGLAAIDIRLDKAELRAPFGATISARTRDPGVSLAAGQPILSLMQADAPQFRVGVSPAIADALALGDRVDVRFGTRSVSAELSSILPDLDPATRTRMLLFSLTGDRLPAFGTVGELRLTQRIDMAGFWLPISALRDGPRGLWQVMTVTEGDAGPVIAGEAVEILHAEAERAFVRGTLAPGMEVVTGGPHRVVPGQAVVMEHDRVSRTARNEEQG
ncbi:MAG: efflux RND transporter periplasmic adaptor subunit [Pseudomonadota bacterium]